MTQNALRTDLFVVYGFLLAFINESAQHPLIF